MWATGAPERALSLQLRSAGAGNDGGAPARVHRDGVRSKFLGLAPYARGPGAVHTSAAAGACRFREVPENRSGGPELGTSPDAF